MKVKKLLEYIRLKWRIGLNMVKINETMALQEVSEVYAKYVCDMNNWPVRVVDGYTEIFCSISLAIMDGYIKAMHDNGYEFKNGIVKKRDILEDMPMGACEYFRKDAIADTKAKAIEALRVVMSKYESSLQNINVIVNDFGKAINKEE